MKRMRRGRKRGREKGGWKDEEGSQKVKEEMRGGERIQDTRNILVPLPKKKS